MEGPPSPGDDTGEAGGVTTLEDIDGVGASRADALRAAGYESVDAVRGASSEDLAEVEGIGTALSNRIKEAVGDAGTPETDGDAGEAEITDDDLARGPVPAGDGGAATASDQETGRPGPPATRT